MWYALTPGNQTWREIHMFLANHHWIARPYLLFPETLRICWWDMGTPKHIAIFAHLICTDRLVRGLKVRLVNQLLTGGLTLKGFLFHCRKKCADSPRWGLPDRQQNWSHYTLCAWGVAELPTGMQAKVGAPQKNGDLTWLTRAIYDGELVV